LLRLPATSSYAGSHTIHSGFYKIQFNILLISTPRSSKWILSFRLRVAILVVIVQKYVSDEYFVTRRVVRVTKITGSRSDDWIYWHFGYNPS
jgi:hypothetical protein